MAKLSTVPARHTLALNEFERLIILASLRYRLTSLALNSNVEGITHNLIDTLTETNDNG